MKKHIKENKDIIQLSFITGYAFLFHSVINNPIMWVVMFNTHGIYFK